MSIDMLSLVRKSINAYNFMKNFNRIINGIRITAAAVTIFIFGINIFSYLKNM